MAGFNRKKYRLGEGRGTFRALWWLGLVPIGGAWMDITTPRGPHWDMRLPSRGQQVTTRCLPRMAEVVTSKEQVWQWMVEAGGGRPEHGDGSGPPASS